MALTHGTVVTDDFAWPQPTSLYIHVPFCRHRCGYCNFSVIAGRDSLIDRFLSAIDWELSQIANQVQNAPPLKTIYLGGGTPTHLSLSQLQLLFSSIRRHCLIDAEAEFSVEANPEDIDEAKVRLLVDLGINRISLGVQSFQPEKLKVLERTHDHEIAKHAIETCSSVIPNVSLDLIFGAPGESLESWLHDLETAFDLPITHLSTYALTFEKGTTFWNGQQRGLVEPVTEEVDLAMYQAVRQMAASHGWKQYEVSNFAKPGSLCRHNLAYWHGRGWYAAGPGSARFLNGKREVNHRSTTTYLKRIAAGRSPTVDSESISLVQYACERAAFGVRMLDGVNLHEIELETGVDLAQLRDVNLAFCLQQGWIEIHSRVVRLTEAGLLMADIVASAFLVERLAQTRFAIG